MWNAVRAVFFLAMSPLGVPATEPYAGLRTPGVQGAVAVGEAQHRFLRRGAGCEGGRGQGRGKGKGKGKSRGRGRGNRDDDDYADVPSPIPADMATLVELHNEARCLHNADPLTYSNKLATSAMAQAEILSSSCGDTDHSEGGVRNGYGENVYACASLETEACYTPEDAIGSLYEFETQGYSVAEYGEHATRILWKSTTEMGCATTTCEKDTLAYVYLVCHYNPIGNNMDDLEEEVDLPTGTSC